MGLASCIYGAYESNVINGRFRCVSAREHLMYRGERLSWKSTPLRCVRVLFCRLEIDFYIAGTTLALSGTSWRLQGARCAHPNDRRHTFAYV